MTTLTVGKQEHNGICGPGSPPPPSPITTLQAAGLLDVLLVENVGSGTLTLVTSMESDNTYRKIARAVLALALRHGHRFGCLEQPFEPQ